MSYTPAPYVGDPAISAELRKISIVINELLQRIEALENP